MDHRPVTNKQAHMLKVQTNEEYEKAAKFLNILNRLSAEVKNHPEKLIPLEELE